MTEPAESSRNERVCRTEWTALIVILFMAIGVRVYLAFVTETVSRDTCTFVWYAQDLAERGVQAVREEDQHPLYPITILAAHGALRPLGLIDAGNAGWASAAVTSACVAGLACVVVMWGMARFLFGLRIGLLAALFMALLPDFAGWSADGLSDPLHLLLYVGALSVGIRGISNRSWAALSAAGVLSGLAFLTRPEGAGVAIVLAPACLLAGTGDRCHRRLARAALLLLGFVAIAAPYMAATGSIVQKKSLGDLLQFKQGPAESAAGELTTVQATVSTVDATNAAGAFVSIVRRWVRTCRVVYFVLGVVGAIAVFWPPDRRAACATITAAGALHFAVLILLVLNFKYGEELSQRHTLVLAALLLPWSAAGLDWIVQRIRNRLPGAKPAGVWTTALILTIGPTAPWLLRPRNPDTAHFIDAGRWIAENRPDAKLVMSSEQRIAFYADRPFKRWPADEGKLDVLLAHVDEFHPDVVAIDVHRVLGGNPAFLTELTASPAAAVRLTRAAAFTGRDERKHRNEIMIFDAAPQPR